ncbi:PTS lactose/cellobiose transporter subunit IIA [Streptococcus suis]
MNISQKDLEIIMQLIMYSGEAKGLAMKAIQEAKRGNKGKADELMKQGHQTLVKAHQAQTSMLTQEAAGEEIPIQLLTIHSQDHLMNTITFLDLAKEIIELYNR